MPHPVIRSCKNIPVPSSAINVLIKSGPGTLHRAISGCDFFGGAAVDFAMFLYDNITASGTPIVSQRFTAGAIPLYFDVDFENGLTARIVRQSSATGSVCIVFS